jgi:ureidoglycolate lyase
VFSNQAVQQDTIAKQSLTKSFMPFIYRRGIAMKIISAQSLTVEAFKPYGWAVMQPEKSPEIENSAVSYWHDMADISNLGNVGTLGFMRVKKNAPLLTTLQKLNRSIEVYLTLDGNPSIEFVALSGSDGQPDLTTLKAFKLSNGQSVVVNVGVWHCTPFSLEEKTDFALILHNDVIILKPDGNYGVDLDTIQYCSLEEEFSID